MTAATGFRPATATDGALPSILKAPAAVLRYTIDWSDWLIGSDTITGAAYTVEDGLVLDDEGNDATTTTAWLSGGTDKEDYLVTCHVVTSNNEEDDRSFIINCRAR